MAELCYQKAHYAAAQIARLPGYSLPVNGPFFQEFVVQCPAPPTEINRKLLKKNILGGLDLTAPSYAPVPPYEGGTTGELSNPLLLCVTEMNTRQDIDALITALGEFN